MLQFCPHPRNRPDPHARNPEHVHPRQQIIRRGVRLGHGEDLANLPPLLRLHQRQDVTQSQQRSRLPRPRRTLPQRHPPRQGLADGRRLARVQVLQPPQRPLCRLHRCRRRHPRRRRLRHRRGLGRPQENGSKRPRPLSFVLHPRRQPVDRVQLTLEPHAVELGSDDDAQRPIGGERRRVVFTHRNAQPDTRASVLFVVNETPLNVPPSTTDEHDASACLIPPERRRGAANRHLDIPHDLRKEPPVDPHLADVHRRPRHLLLHPPSLFFGLGHQRSAQGLLQERARRRRGGSRRLLVSSRWHGPGRRSGRRRRRRRRWRTPCGSRHTARDEGDMCYLHGMVTSR